MTSAREANHCPSSQTLLTRLHRLYGSRNIRHDFGGRRMALASEVARVLVRSGESPERLAGECGGEHSLINDDGIATPGLWAAARVLAKVGQVTVVAPTTNYSGYGAALPPAHSFSCFPYRHPDGQPRNVKAYGLAGTPAACAHVVCAGRCVSTLIWSSAESTRALTWAMMSSTRTPWARR
jgi:hypothetical protein